MRAKTRSHVRVVLYGILIVYVNILVLFIYIDYILYWYHTGFQIRIFLHLLELPQNRIIQYTPLSVSFIFSFPLRMTRIDG
jgi:hypothetical protein